MTARRVRVIVAGKVQGVFFRQTMKVEARKAGVSGWVRNLDDGGVEALLDGDAAAVGRVVEWCRAGPAGARVSGVEVADEARDVGLSEFEVRY